jgi:hypothetical protein
MKAAELSLEVNFELLETPLDKVVVYLGPEEFKSTWQQGHLPHTHGDRRRWQAPCTGPRGVSLRRGQAYRRAHSQVSLPHDFTHVTL